MEQLVSHTTGDVLLVTHKGPLRELVLRLTGAQAAGFSEAITYASGVHATDVVLVGTWHSLLLQYC